MTVIEMGDIGSRYNDWMPENDQLPERGIIIEATQDELKALGVCLYKSVKVVPADAEDPELARWRKQALEENAALDVLRAEMAEKDDCITVLKRALKGVMQIDMSDETKFTQTQVTMAVAEAQRIIIEAWDDKNYFENAKGETK